MSRFEDELNERLLANPVAVVLTALLSRAVAEAVDRPGEEDMLRRPELALLVGSALNEAIARTCKEYLQSSEQQLNIQTWWHRSTNGIGDG